MFRLLNYSEFNQSVRFPAWLGLLLVTFCLISWSSMANDVTP